MSDDPTYQQELSVEVKAGQTLVLEITARAAPASGAFEITVNGASGLSRVYLAGSARSYEVPLDATGKGNKAGLTPGSYQLTLTRPTNL